MRIPRSATAVTVLVIWYVLLFGVGSVVVLVIVAVFVMVPPAFGAVAVTVMMLDAPALSVAIEQLALAVHAQPEPVAVMNEVPPINVSVTTTFDAAEGPLLVIASV